MSEHEPREEAREEEALTDEFKETDENEAAPCCESEAPQAADVPDAPAVPTDADETACEADESETVAGDEADDESDDDAPDASDEADDESDDNEPDASDESDTADEPDGKPESDGSASEADAHDADEPREFDFGEAETRLLALQQRLRELKIPTVIVIEGWSAAGKGTMTGELLEGLDPRGYSVHVRERISECEDGYPPLRRYWVNMPKAGDISIFIGSWYHDACEAAARSKRGARELDARLERINQMERMLACDGVLMLKFFINISEKEQKRRFKELEARKLTRRLVTKSDRAQNERYDEWRGVYNHMLAATDEPYSEWRVLPGKVKRECKRQMYTAVTEAFERAIALRESGERPWDVPELGEHEPPRVEPIPPLSDYETSRTLDEPYKQAMDAAKSKLRALQYELYRKGIPMVLAFEGWDAAGKGGAIRRLSSALDARGFTVVPTSAPTPEEKAHHHLWRFWRTLPRAGFITLYDRTWYGRVMVERIEGFCTENQWKRAYEELNLFERDLYENGAVVLKFWLQISSDEQLKRFIDRRDDPEKSWKITDEDWRNREKWPLYEAAVNEMLMKTNTKHAPWIVVEGDNKQFARLKVLNAVIAAAEARLK